MTDEVRYVRSPHVLQRRTLDAFVLLAVEGADPLVVTGTGADVWTLVADPRSVAEIVEVLAEHYSGEAAAIASDVQALLDLLVSAGSILRIDA